MERLDDFGLIELTGAELWQWVSTLMEEGFDSADADGVADAAPFKMVAHILDELVHRYPDSRERRCINLQVTLQGMNPSSKGCLVKLRR